MHLGFSLGIFALGAILKFAITDNVNGINLGTVGVILMIVGVIGFIISLVLMLVRRRTDVIHENGYADGYAAPPAPGARRTTYIEPNDRY